MAKKHFYAVYDGTESSIAVTYVPQEGTDSFTSVKRELLEHLTEERDALNYAIGRIRALRKDDVAVG